MIRQNFLVNDVQVCIKALFDEMVSNTSPWTSWAVTEDFPTTTILMELAKPLICIESPMITEREHIQGGLYNTILVIRINVWVDQKTGGAKELNIIESTLSYFFMNPQTRNSQTFDVTLGTLYENTTLKNQGIAVQTFEGGRDIQTEDENQLRKQFLLTVKA